MAVLKKRAQGDETPEGIEPTPTLLPTNGLPVAQASKADIEADCLV
jgi:hypothetical protein